ncbi:MAG: nucleotidyltransferase family protein [Clostridia bacterium]|nr:nucleotidyltransferase family protein [Clostridia bacterium]
MSENNNCGTGCAELTATAVVCELNPYHNGHSAVMKAAGSKADITVAVMSGSFTQRTEPALFDKYTRAAAALADGADLVVELPFPWSCMGAEGYASAGVHIASCLGCSSLTFGSESGDEGYLRKAAEIKDSGRFPEVLRRMETMFPEKGSAEIFDAAMAELGLEHSPGPNDKLGLEYIRAGRKRSVNEFNVVSRDPDIMTASGLRKMILENGTEGAADHMPPGALEIFSRAAAVDPRFFDRYLFVMCREMKNAGKLLSYASKTARRSRDPGEFIRELPTKKYTLSRMRREIMFGITGASGDAGDPLYTVLLGAGSRGRDYLGRIRDRTSLHVITKPSDTGGLSGEAKEQYRLLNRADEIYTLGMKKEAGYFLTRGPVIVREDCDGTERIP